MLALGSHPIAHRFLKKPDDNEYTHDLTLLVCDHCGLAQVNDPIPPDELYTNYNWLSSWKPQIHIPRLIELIQKYMKLQPDSRIIEAGANDGTFLAALREKGFKNLLGVEPAKDAESSARTKGLRMINGYFNQQLADKIVTEDGRYDLFIVRQVLEHITPLAEFRSAIETVTTPNGYVLIEVPDFEFCLENTDYSAIWEEHVNYFTKETLEKYLNQAGIDLLHVETAQFSGQALIALGQRASKKTASVPAMSVQLKSKNDRYRERWKTFPTDLINYLKSHKSAGKKIAVYGGGCRAAGLINFAGLSPYIDCVLDDQEEKQNRYMPGSRLPIYPGGDLEKRSIDLCLLAVNAENESKVLGNHNAYKGEFVSLHPPSSRLPKFWKDAL
jgi:hypothetical protein